jgi:KDO2-lipid IV(A) lauroyltransferase
MTLRTRLADATYWLGWNALWLLPAPVSRALFDIVGRAAWRLQTTGVRQLRLNLARAMGLDPQAPEVGAAAHRAIRSYMRYYCETFLLPRWSPADIQARVRTIDEHHLADAVARGGAIVTLTHSANWDLAGAWCATRYGTLATIAERLRPEGVFRKFMAMRQSLGIELMPLTGEPGIYEFLRHHVVQGHLVALLGDRDVARNGMSNEFFGAKASLPVGAAMLALDTGRPLITCGLHYDGPVMVVTFDPPITVTGPPPVGRDRLRRAQEVTAQVADRFEEHIRLHPESWHQLQPVWNDLVVSEAR